MTHWKLTLAYDGTPYNGWQVQPSLPTIQGTLADAIHRITGERVLPQGSGRTDTGVHALAQVASCSLAAPIPPASFHRALNRCLPPSIRVLTAETVPPSFHARHSAIAKTYQYRIFPLHQELQPDRICPPTLAPYVWPCPWPLDLTALNQAASHILGAHDFTTFAATDPDASARATKPGAPQPALSMPKGLDAEMWVGPPQNSTESLAMCPIHDSLTVMSGNAAPTSSPPHPPIRTIHHSRWHTHEDLFLYTITGTGFLHHMVRNLVGTFVQAGANRLDPNAIPTLLATRNRAAAGPTAPATGLFLVSVTYPAVLHSQLPTHNSQLPL